LDKKLSSLWEYYGTLVKDDKLFFEWSLLRDEKDNISYNTKINKLKEKGFIPLIDVFNPFI
jgi:hypothetical protein